MEKKSGRVELKLLLYYIVALVMMYLVLLGHEVVPRVKFESEDSLTDWLTLIVSAGALVVSSAAFWYLRRTFRATKDQIRAAEDAYIADNRPWLRVEILKVAYHWEEDPCITFSMMLKNYGKSVAQDVSIQFHFVEQGEEDINSSQDKLLNFINGVGARTHVNQYGINVFPGDQDIIDHALSRENHAYVAFIDSKKRSMLLSATYQYTSNARVETYLTSAVFWFQPKKYDVVPFPIAPKIYSCVT